MATRQALVPTIPLVRFRVCFDSVARERVDLDEYTHTHKATNGADDGRQTQQPTQPLLAAATQRERMKANRRRRGTERNETIKQTNEPPFSHHDCKPPFYCNRLFTLLPVARASFFILFPTTPTRCQASPHKTMSIRVEIVEIVANLWYVCWCLLLPPKVRSYCHSSAVPHLKTGTKKTTV